jgi:hypothetical protein
MVANGVAVLDAEAGAASPSTETALLAASVGLVCRGQPREADALLTKNAARFFRKNERETELRYLLGLTTTAFNTLKPAGPCTRPAVAAITPTYFSRPASILTGSPFASDVR